MMMNYSRSDIAAKARQWTLNLSESFMNNSERLAEDKAAQPDQSNQHSKSDRIFKWD